MADKKALMELIDLSGEPLMVDADMVRGEDSNGFAMFVRGDEYHAYKDGYWMIGTEKEIQVATSK
jgi:hypothetical protein